ncbi:serine hydrolase domain-containing protein [Nonomuraea sediminis]|uniref:serine hydrolase domain-containing protein n=1 Tax=Nonomuraea sediminis TaxID=2835864 RepID=UPI00202A97B0|nr:serine hydrolase domain-containing protein [Nonomuraea sediminis]
MIAGLAFAAVAVTGSPAQAATKPDPTQQAMESLANADGVVGAIAELYEDGRRVGHGSAGSRLLDGKGGRIPSSSRFRIGSQTKMMTATVILQLVKEGKLGLDDKLSDVLPVVAEQDLVEKADEITVRQLIRFTSGIPDFFQTGKFDPFDYTTYYSPTDLVKASRSLPRTGTTFNYSNTNYVLLGMIIEKVTGHSLSAELSTRIFKPLGMTRTYLPVRPPQGIVGPHGHGYFPDEQGTLRDMDRQNASYGGAAGGVISTAHDVSAFHSAFAQGKLLPADLQRVFTDPPEGMPKPPQGGGLCGGKVAIRPWAGGAPGFNAVTFVTADGRKELAISATVSVKDLRSLDPVINQAAKSVLCP